MTAEIPESLVAYLTARDRERNEQVDRKWAELTDRERRLVREAAVMGYVRGTFAAGGESVPKDSAVVRHIIACCQTFPDMYPLLGGTADSGEEPPEDDAPHT
jgi:hypothetical protein